MPTEAKVLLTLLILAVCAIFGAIVIRDRERSLFILHIGLYLCMAAVGMGLFMIWTIR